MDTDFYLVDGMPVRKRSSATVLPAVAAVAPVVKAIAEEDPASAPVVEVAAPAAEPAPEQYDYNASTGKYHRVDCRFVGAELTLKTLAELRELDATPCTKCKPPAWE